MTFHPHRTIARADGPASAESGSRKAPDGHVFPVDNSAEARAQVVSAGSGSRKAPEGATTPGASPAEARAITRAIAANHPSTRSLRLRRKPDDAARPQLPRGRAQLRIINGDLA